MINQALAFVANAIASLFILAALIRFWMQAFRAPSRNPIAYFSMAVTDWAVKPLRRVVPGVLKLDWASLIVAWALEFVLQAVLVFLLSPAPIENPAVLSVVFFMAFVEMIRLSIYIFMGALIIQVVLSWVSPYHPMAPFTNAFVNPFTKPLRRVIPPLGGLDITPLFVFIFFQLLLMLPVAWLEHETAAMMARALL